MISPSYCDDIIITSAAETAMNTRKPAITKAPAAPYQHVTVNENLLQLPIMVNQSIHQETFKVV